MKKIFILTGEPSGDKLASTIISKLKHINSEIEYLCVGGSNLKKLGISHDKFVSEKLIVEKKILLKAIEQLKKTKHVEEGFLEQPKGVTIENWKNGENERKTIENWKNGEKQLKIGKMEKMREKQ